MTVKKPERRYWRAGDGNDPTIRLLLSEEAPTLILQRFNLGFNTAEMKSSKASVYQISDIPAPELGIMYNLY